MALTANDFAPGAGADKVPALGCAPVADLLPGDVVTMTWADIPPPNTGNWVGLYAAGGNDSDFLAEKPIDTPPAPAPNTANFVLPENLLPGNYELRLFTRKVGGARLVTGPALLVKDAGNTGSGGISVVSATSFGPSGVVTLQIQNSLSAPSSPGHTIALWCIETGADVATIHSTATFGRVDFTLPADLAPNLHYMFLYRRLDTTEVWGATPAWLWNVVSPQGSLSRVWDFLRANGSRQDVTWSTTVGRAKNLIAIRPRGAPDVTVDAQYLPPGATSGTAYFTIDGKYTVGTQYEFWLYDAAPPEGTGQPIFRGGLFSIIA
jgi:hypothetical protein